MQDAAERDPRLPAGAGPRPRVTGGAHRARSAVPPHRAVGAADRRAGAPRRAAGDRRAELVRFRLEIGQIWAARLFDAGQSITAYQQVLDIDPANLVALRALEALYEKTDQNEKYLDASRRSSTRRRRTPSAWRSTSASPRCGRSGSASSIARPRRREDRRDRQPRNYSRVPPAGPPVPAGRKWEALVETYRNHILATADVATRVELYVAMGKVYDQTWAIDRAVQAYANVLGSTPTSRARSTRSAGCTSRSASGTARST